MSEGAVRDDMTLKMTAERARGSKIFRAKPQTRREFPHARFRLDSHFQLALFYTSELGDAVFRSRPTLVHIMCHGLDLPPDFFLR